MSDVHLDESVATKYDERSTKAFSVEVLGPTVDFLAALAEGGRALEFAIGTGRVGLPLSERGIQVTGIEFSEPMLNQLRLKNGAEKIEVILGDMTSTLAEGDFQLVYLVYNTIMNLKEQARQVACFKNAAAHLKPGGCFAMEVMVPRLRSLPPGEKYQPFSVSEAHIGLDEYVSFTDQILKSHHVYNDEGRHRQMVGAYRWVWPSELDLMAQLAGMQLIGRWADWDRSPFTDDSDKHISVWRKLDLNE
jgi:SAM-dependent methyltransferase